MVQSSRNGGKYLTKRWQRMREQALVDRTRFSPSELAWLEVKEHEGRGEFDPAAYQAETTPIDPLTRPRRIDIRDREDW